MTVRIYLRVSQEDEAPIFENQKVELLKEADAVSPGVPPVIYEDFAQSGADEDRPGLGKMLHEARRNDVILFTSLSRMTRGGVGASFDILRQLDRMGVYYHFTELPILNSDAKTPKLVKDLVQAVFAAIDEDYRRRISVATKAAYARRKALAEANGDAFEWGRRGPGKKRVSPPTPPVGPR